MNEDQSEGVKEQINGWVNAAIGKVSGNQDRKVKGKVQVTNRANRKDHDDQKDNFENGVENPGEPTNR